MFKPGVSGNPGGKPLKVKTRREVKETEFNSLLRKVKPHVGIAVTVIAKMLTSPTTSDGNKLKAAEFIIDTYRDAVEELFERDGTTQDSLGQASQDDSAAAVFSLKVVGQDDKK